MFDLAANLEDPVNLSIGQPDFPVPRPVKDAYIKAIEEDKNGYALTQGMPVLRDKLQAEVDAQYGHDDREVFVCSGTSGGLNLSVLSMINPGDEVIYFDPFFVMYPAIIELTGGKSVKVSIYPDFKLDMDKLEAAITKASQNWRPSTGSAWCPTRFTASSCTTNLTFRRPSITLRRS